MPDRLPCLVLSGPTAVGKTGILDRLAEGFGQPLEVISADAFQVYRGLDLGTAKPAPDLLKRIPHHLINIRDIHESFNVGDFVHAAEGLIAEIRMRGSLPVICGGTVYYIKHLIGGLPESPPVDLAIRKELQKRLDMLGPDRLREDLMAVDPVSATRIAPRDHYRLLRALEVWQTSGRALSSFEMGKIDDQSDYVMIGLTRSRTELVERIKHRVRAMFKAGLAEEVRALLAAGYQASEPGMKAIGYQEFLDGNSLRADLRQVEEEIFTHTRQYAKRQMTFLRGLGITQWVDASNEFDASQEIVARLQAVDLKPL